MEWSKTKKYNPSGPGYPEAGEYYVLKSEAEEKIEALEKEYVDPLDKTYWAKEAGRLSAENAFLTQRLEKLQAQADRIRELEAADEQSRQQYLIVSARAEAAEAELRSRECYGEWCGKSPTRKSSGLCPACEWRRVRDEP